MTAARPAKKKSARTLARIKALADDRRGDPKTRAVAQAKLAALTPSAADDMLAMKFKGRPGVALIYRMPGQIARSRILYSLEPEQWEDAS